MRHTAYWALGLLTAATLMLQVTLTRIFSVIMWYHMSLVCVSLAMFGMALGALLVERDKDAFDATKALGSCSRHSLLFVLFIVPSLVLCLNAPIAFESNTQGTLLLLAWSTIVSLPFISSGVVVCAMLTRFPEYVGKLYAADLAGAALGCLVVVFLLNYLDAPTTVLVAALLGALAGVGFIKAQFPEGSRRLHVAGLISLLLLLLTVLNHHSGFIRIRYVLGERLYEQGMRHEFWNSFSYVTVSTPQHKAQYWGPGDRAQLDPPGTQVLDVMMDTRASTAMVKFNGDWESVEWLLYDATNAVHHLRPTGSVLVIGVGAGRDVLSALIPSLGTRSVTGVDINPRMISLLRDVEKEFSGNIAELENVSLYVDEARSWLQRSNKRFDVITIPLVDTSAASASGAFALTENALYTVEAFEEFLRSLNQGGMLSVSRWWWKGRLGETHRLVGLARDALTRIGVSKPRDHIIVVRGGDLATLLLSPTALSEQDQLALKEVAELRGFEILLSPWSEASTSLVEVVENSDWAQSHQLAEVLDLTPSTDDRPFFFHSYRISNLLRALWGGNGLKMGFAQFDKTAVVVLATLLLVVTFLTALFVLIPAVKTYREKNFSASADTVLTLAYFASIGLGFMFFESAQIQRLNIFLGYPIYSLTVVLFTLLLSSACGSFIAGWLMERSGGVPFKRCWAVLILILLASGAITAEVTELYSSAQTSTRIVLAAGLMAIPGLMMGMFFPFGMTLIAKRKEISSAWCWAINGIFSTFGAVASIAFSISFGFESIFWSCVFCYFFTGAFGLWLSKAKA